MPDYVDLTLHAAKRIHETKPAGDILVSLASSNQIDLAITKPHAGISGLEVMPVYSQLSKAEQAKAVSSASKRKCIVPINIACTSLTIDGTVYVVDGGIEKQKGYNPRANFTTLLTAPISKASAKQRAFRPGRTQAGVCFRLYTKETFHKVLIDSTPPGLLKSHITAQILTLKRIQKRMALSSKALEIWSFKTSLIVAAIKEALTIHDNLSSPIKALMRIKGIPILNFSNAKYAIKIRKALARDFFHNAAVVKDAKRDQYRTLDNQ
ncbi:pre-mrna splicing factor rna helicase protein [Fusarium avenaceum]|nr:pre-mrna splicing factor rna helicase protein [Fusarium avenaceum]